MTVSFVRYARSAAFLFVIGAMFSGTAEAQTYALVCEPPNPAWTAETFVVDPVARRVSFQSVLVATYRFDLPVTMSDRTIEWVNQRERYTVDRYSGVLARTSPDGQVYWRCKKQEKL